MIRMLTAFTDEVDEADSAVRDILDQLDLDGRQLAHSVGLLFCHAEFVDTGVMRAVCEALPFAVAGCTTMGNAATGNAGVMTLSLSVLTSDDVEFSAAMSGALTPGNVAAEVASAFTRAAGPFNGAGRPALAVSFSPLMGSLGGEVIAHALFKAAGETPVFGTTACDHTPGYTRSCTILNGRAEKDALVTVLMRGNVTPHFFLTVVSEERVQKQKAMITASEGNTLCEVNGMPLMQYLETLSVSRNNGIENIGVVPFIVSYNDGSPPVARAMITITPEGHAVCGGKMPVGSTLAVGRLEKDDILETMKKTAHDGAETGAGGMLLFPCMSRSMALGADYLAEMDVAEETVNNRLPYQIAYAGGELCPAFDDSGKRVNCYHNFTLVACAF